MMQLETLALVNKHSLKCLAFLKDGTNKSSFPNTGYFSGVVGFPEYDC
jgi:hypothetical protein